MTTRQLQSFRAFEACWQARRPAVHELFRRVYNVWGYRASRLIRWRWMADLVYLMLKPAEWTACLLLRLWA